MGYSYVNLKGKVLLVKLEKKLKSDLLSSKPHSGSLVPLTISVIMIFKNVP